MAKEKKVKVKSKTVRQRNALKAANITMWGAKFALPFVPATVVTAINWDEWFANTHGSLPAGFLLMVVGTLVSIIGIWKKDKFMEKHISPLFILVIGLVLVASAFLLLANIMYQAGMMFLYCAAGALAAAVDDQVQMSVIAPNLAEIEEDIKEGGLDKKTNKRAERRKRRLKEMEEAQRRAVE